MLFSLASDSLLAPPSPLPPPFLALSSPAIPPILPLSSPATPSPLSLSSPDPVNTRAVELSRPAGYVVWKSLPRREEKNGGGGKIDVNDEKQGHGGIVFNGDIGRKEGGISNGLCK